MDTLDRRSFLTLGSLLLSAPLCFAGTGEGGNSPLFLSAATEPGDMHFVKAFTLKDGKAEQVFQHRLPARAHHIAAHQDSGLFVVVARRPGNFLLVGEIATGRILQQLYTPQDRHLLGHGIFTPDGQKFLAVESDYQDMTGESGRIVTWEFSGKGHGFSARRANDYPSYGVGPHELLLLPDQPVLVVANGGIRTHPDTGREKLNLDSMQPSLTYLDSQSGKLLEKRELDAVWHQASIRHLDVNREGRVAFVMQYEGQPFEQAPLVGLHHRGEEIRIPEVPPDVRRQMQQYCGSVRFDHSGRFLAVSCPKGNMITFWDVQSEKFMASVRSRDGCGVCAAGRGFLFTAGTGRIAWYDIESGKADDVGEISGNSVFWDNHLSVVAG